MNTLCLSLGHNSSAVYISDKGAVIGYETERLSRVKSDSAFPLRPILVILQQIDTADYPTLICISHWFDNFNPYTSENKYYSAQELTSLLPHATLVACSAEGTTHHKAHALSSIAFAGPNRDALTIVVDGFGTGQEVGSAFLGDQLFSRVTGYANSLGLLYQHAAEACGMDGINDVYKFLGYRTHVTSGDMRICAVVIAEIRERMMPAWSQQTIDPLRIDHGKLMDYDAFYEAKTYHKALFNTLIDDDKFASRCRVGYVVQEVLEDCVVQYIGSQVRFDSLNLVGGCFLNVRLNDKIRKTFKGTKICVMPLAGDQGAAIGLAHSISPVPREIFDTLCWGARRFYDRPYGFFKKLPLNDKTIELLADLISRGVIVNVCYGNMEYGPRALCHTSTLALPRMSLVDAINVANGRTTIMPMAPVMLKDVADQYFSTLDLQRTHRSDAYMVTAHDYLPHVDVNVIRGAAHADLNGVYSGRPQLVCPHEPFIGALLRLLRNRYDINVIINTSLNIHGQPIVYDSDSLQATALEWRVTCPLPYEFFVIEDETS